MEYTSHYEGIHLEKKKLDKIEEEVENINQKENNCYINSSNCYSYSYSNENNDKLQDKVTSNNKNKYKFSNSALTNPNAIDDSNIYDYLIQFKEKNNALQLRMNDMNKIKIELESKNFRVVELENSINSYKQEINRLVKKNEENLKLNQFWESTFREIKSKIIIIEDEKLKLREDADNWKAKFEDLQFKFEIQQDKSRISEENSFMLKRVQNEYEKSFNEIKNNYRNKEDNLKKKYLELKENNQNKLNESESEYYNEKEKLIEKCRNLEREVSKHQNIISELDDKMQNIKIENKSSEAEYMLIIEERDNKIRDIQISLDKITLEANEHISKLCEDISNINEKICDKENYLRDEVTSYEKKLKVEIEKNKNYQSKIESMNNSFTHRDRDNDFIKEKNILVGNLEKEVLHLKGKLNKKQEEIDKMLNDVTKRTINSLNSSDIYTSKFNSNRSEVDNGLEKLRKRSEENKILEKKNNELEHKFNELREHFDRTMFDYKCEINKKNEEIYLLKINYDKTVDDLKLNLDKVFN